jgi:hypothetical protein
MTVSGFKPETDRERVLQEQMLRAFRNLHARHCEQALAAPAEGAESFPELVIGLLIAGGHVTQAKVDEARAIALGCEDRAATQEVGDG